MHQRVHVGPHELLGRVAKHGVDGRGNEQEGSVRRQARLQIPRLLSQLTKLPLTFRERFLRAPRR